MPFFQKAPQSVLDLAADILTSYDPHKPLCDAKVKIDYVMAFGDVDEETGARINDAIKERGRRIFGQARIINLKDRAKGMGDAEILLDGDYWDGLPDVEKRALLDHQLHHVALKTVKGILQRDDLGRPKIKMRKHDAEFGWFSVIAERHGKASIERIQGECLAEGYGQFFFPGFAPAKA